MVTIPSDHTQLRVGLLGWPVGHSVSPAMHNAAFAALGMNWHYEALAVAPEQLAEVVQGLVGLGYRGVNVTIPHKQAVMPLMDELSDAARRIGAVNTVVVEPGGRLLGDNTDWLGFLYPLDQRSFDLQGRFALLLGAGGSARAVGFALARRNVARIAVWNRSTARAEKLASELRQAGAEAPEPRVEVLAGSDLSQLVGSPINELDLIVNTTPVGMWPHAEASPWPGDLPLPPGVLVYDLVYRPERTLLLQQADSAGCPTQGGLEMLVVQGAVSFELWTGSRPPLEIMMTAAREALFRPQAPVV